MTSPITVVFEDIADDGNYTALVRTYGREYAISFVANEIRIHRTNGSDYERLATWKRNADRKAVEAFAAGRIAEQGHAFLQAHQSLYGVAA